MHRAYFTRYDIAQIAMTAARNLGFDPSLLILPNGYRVRW